MSFVVAAFGVVWTFMAFSMAPLMAIFGVGEMCFHNIAVLPAFNKYNVVYIGSLSSCGFYV